MKKLLTILFISLLIVGCSCSNNNPDANPDAPGNNQESGNNDPGTVGMPNPMHESSAEEFKKYGYEAALDENASDVAYTLIYSSATEEKLADIVYSLDGVDYRYRMQFTEGDAGDIAGDYTTYSKNEDVDVNGYSGHVHYNKDGAGYITWFDKNVGVDYSLSMSTKASAENLLAAAKLVFIPMPKDYK